MKRFTILLWLLCFICLGAMAQGQTVPTLTTDVNNPVLYQIKNLRTDRGRHPTFASTVLSHGQVKLSITDELNASAELMAGSLWYFTTASAPDGVTVPENVTPVYMHNLLAEQPLTNQANGTWDGTQIWYLTPNTNGDQVGFSISNTCAEGYLGNNGYSWNNAAGSGLNVAFYAGNDPGSIWEFVPNETTVTDAYNNAAQEICENGKKYLTGNGELLNQWEATVEENMTYAKLAAMPTTLTSLRNQTTLTPVDGMSIRIENYQYTNQFMGLNASGAMARISSQDNTSVFTFKQAEGGWYLFNEYAHKYVKHPTGDNQTAALVSTAAQASVYEVVNKLEGTIGSFGLKNLTNPVTNREYLHADGSNRIVRWQAANSNPSKWRFISVSDEDIANASLSGALAQASTKTIGDKVQQYNTPAGNFAVVRNAAQATSENESATKDKKVEAANNLWDALSELTLNLPTPGKFYRFKGAANNKRMTSTINSSNKINMVDDGSNTLETVFYLDDNNHLVGLQNGLCLGQFRGNDQGNSWRVLISTSDRVANVQFQEAPGLPGYYNIIPSLGRYIYNKNATVNCGGSDGDGYRWKIEEVECLPVPMNEEVGYGTLYSPVPLGKGYSDDCVKVYTGVINGEYFTLNEVTGNIPANTPVVLKYVKGIENGCVYLPVAASAEAVTTQNDLGGAVLAQAKTSVTEGTLCTLQYIDNEVGFYEYTGDNLSGFKAYLNVPANSPVNRFIFGNGTTTGIENAVSTQEKEVFYDLNGRVVVYPTHGIYVTGSGKKVLFK